MASKNKNPYPNTSKKNGYRAIFEAIRASKGIVTRQSLIEQGFSVHDITVVLSPRTEGSSKRGGDCRGNMSAQGHVYFMHKLKEVKGESQRFQLRFRKVAMDKRVRAPKKDVKSQKEVKVSKVTTKAKATTKTKATIKA